MIYRDATTSLKDYPNPDKICQVLHRMLSPVGSPVGSELGNLVNLRFPFSQVKETSELICVNVRIGTDWRYESVGSHFALQVLSYTPLPADNEHFAYHIAAISWLVARVEMSDEARKELTLLLRVKIAEHTALTMSAFTNGFGTTQEGATVDKIAFKNGQVAALIQVGDSEPCWVSPAGSQLEVDYSWNIVEI